MFEILKIGKDNSFFLIENSRVLASLTVAIQAAAVLALSQLWLVLISQQYNFSKTSFNKRFKSSQVDLCYKKTSGSYPRLNPPVTSGGSSVDL